MIAPDEPRTSTPNDMSRAAGPVADPGEERMRVQGAISSLLRSMASEQMLVLAVDDAQRADEASMALLAALARDAASGAIYIVTALRTGEPVRAEQAIGILQQSGPRVSLGGLDEEEVGDLVRSYFGDVDHASRLASFMHRVSRGSPMLCSELARHLVDNNVVRYREGDWLLPVELSHAHVPQGLGAAIQSRLQTLGPKIRGLGELLAVHGGKVSLDTVVALVGEPPQAVFPALDELVRHAVVLESAGMFELRHDQLREGLLRNLPAKRLAELHLRVGEQLLREQSAESRDAAIGWHLMAGGEKARGAELLERAGKRLFDAQALMDCLAPLEAAHEALVEAEAPQHRILPILFMLLAAGWVADRKVGARYASQTVHAYRDAAGLSLAARLGRYTGRHVALLLAVLLASLRWVFTGMRGPSPGQALVSFPVALGYACGLTYAANKRAEVLELVRLVDPLDAFRSRLPHAAYLGMQVFPAILDGRLGEAEGLLARALHLVESDRLTPVAEIERQFIEVGLRGLLVISYVNQFDPRLDAELSRIEALPFRYYHLVAQTARAVRHRYRGEEESARAVEKASEAASLQLGSWSTDLQRTLFAHPAYALCHDLSGLKRCADELSSYVEQGFQFEARVTMTNAERLRERGQHDEARHLLQSLYASLPEHDYLMRQWAGSALAEVEIESKHAESALRVALEVIALGESEAHGLLLTLLRCERIAGMAQARLGRVREAKERLRAAAELAEARSCPVLAGHLHESLALLALEEGDRLDYEVHCARTAESLLPTNNPFLIAVHERLVRAGQPGAEQIPTPAPSYSTGDAPTVELGRPSENDSESKTKRARRV